MMTGHFNVLAEPITRYMSLLLLL